MRKVIMYCDRCGKEFKKWDHKHDEIIGIAEIVHDDGNPYLDTQEDLCESCYTELEKWWNFTPQQTRWIPVSERLPEDGRNVLFCDIDEDIMVGYHIKGRPDTHFSQQGTYDDIKNVKAWMPLPEPYQSND